MTPLAIASVVSLQQGPVGTTGVSLEDLSPVVESAQLVGLGEHMHTSGGVLELRVGVTKELIRERGFRLVLLETGALSSEPASRFFESCEGNPVEAIGSLYGVFQDVSMLELLRFGCAWNQAHPDDPVRFAGFDVQDVASAAEVLSESRPELEVSACSQEYWRRPRIGRRAINDCLRRYSTALESSTSGSAEHTALQVMVFWHEALGLPSFRLKRAYGLRDRWMAEVIESHLVSGARGVVLAHNGHIAESGSAPLPMGVHLAEELGALYSPIAFSALETGIEWPGLRVDPPRTGPVEELVQDAQGDSVVVMASQIPPVSKLGDYYGDPAAAFSAVVVMKRSRPMLPMWWFADVDSVPARGREHCFSDASYEWERDELAVLVARGLTAAGATQLDESHWDFEGRQVKVTSGSGALACVKIQPAEEHFH